VGEWWAGGRAARGALPIIEACERWLVPAAAASAARCCCPALPAWPAIPSDRPALMCAVPALPDWWLQVCCRWLRPRQGAGCHGDNLQCGRPQRPECRRRRLLRWAVGSWWRGCGIVTYTLLSNIILEPLDASASSLARCLAAPCPSQLPHPTHPPLPPPLPTPPRLLQRTCRWCASWAPPTPAAGAANE
jgi:hypothetical protein